MYSAILIHIELCYVSPYVYLHISTTLYNTRRQAFFTKNKDDTVEKITHRYYLLLYYYYCTPERESAVLINIELCISYVSTHLQL